MPQQHANTRIRRERDAAVLKRQMLLLGSCLLLAVGFIMAARQQIVAVQYGYETEKLRSERENLLDEQKRLLLSLEEHSSPAQLERAARELGLQPTRATQIATGAQQEEAKDASGGAHAFVGAAAAGASLRR
jgi:cell division protein FtsL